MYKFTILLIAILTSQFTFSQKEITVEESITSIAEGSNNALSVVIFEADEKFIEKAWKKFMKDYKAKVSSKNDIFADDAEIKDISINPLDIYAKIEINSNGDCVLFVAFDLGGSFLSSSKHPDKFKSAKRILRDFGLSTSKEAIMEKLKEAEKALKKMENDKESLIKENEDLHKKIEGWQMDIEKAKDDIKNNEQAQHDKAKEIDKQIIILEEIKEKEKQIK